MRLRALIACWLLVFSGCSFRTDTYELDRPANGNAGAAGVADEMSPIEEPVSEAQDSDVEPDRERPPLGPRDVAQGQLDELQGGACANGCAVAGQGNEPAKPGEVACRAQLDWASSPGWIEEGSHVVSDSQGNVYVAGTVADNVTFGPFVVNVDLKALGFIAKLDSNCTPIELRTFEGDARAEVRFAALAIDRDDNLILGGELMGTADFGLGPITSTDHPDVEYGIAGIVLKVSPAGEVLWQRELNSRYTSTRVYDLDVTASGDILATGYGASDVHFDGTEGSSDSGKSVMFVARIGASGELGTISTLWGMDAYGAVAAGPSGNVAITGYAYAAQGTGMFDGVMWPQDRYDRFLLVLDPSGAVALTQSLELLEPDAIDGSLGYTIAFDRSGNILVEHGRSTIHDDGTWSHEPQTLLKLAPDGTEAWSLASQYDGDADIYWMGDLAADSQGDIVHADELVPGVTLDGETFEVHGARDLLIRKVDAQGMPLWSTQLGSDGDDYLLGITTDRDDAVWVGLASKGADYTNGTVIITKLGP